MLVACLSLLVPLPAAIPAIVCVLVLGIWIIFGCFWYLESRLYLVFGIWAVFGIWDRRLYFVFGIGAVFRIWESVIGIWDRWCIWYLSWIFGIKCFIWYLWECVCYRRRIIFVFGRAFPAFVHESKFAIATRSKADWVGKKQSNYFLMLFGKLFELKIWASLISFVVLKVGKNCVGKNSKLCNSLSHHSIWVPISVELIVT